MRTSEVLREARSVLFERGWCKKALENQKGEVCALGALHMACHGRIEAGNPSPERVAAFSALMMVAPGHDPVGFNNAPETRFDDIVDLFDRAEKLAEERETS